jgi:hypothetical protein
MSRIQEGFQDFAHYEDEKVFTEVGINDFPEDVFREIFVRHDPDAEDGRSQVVQIRFPNGDLFLGFAPQGDTYSEIEEYYL